MDASESVSHACAEAAGTAGPVYTTGSIFNTKNMSVTGAHFIRTFFFFFYCAFVERRKLTLLKKSSSGENKDLWYLLTFVN